MELSMARLAEETRAIAECFLVDTKTEGSGKMLVRKNILSSLIFPQKVCCLLSDLTRIHVNTKGDTYYPPACREGNISASPIAVLMNAFLSLIP